MEGRSYKRKFDDEDVRILCSEDTQDCVCCAHAATLSTQWCVFPWSPQIFMAIIRDLNFEGTFYSSPIFRGIVLYSED